MKEITLKFREVAVDGLPKESMRCAVVNQYYELQPNALDYSARHGVFNAIDSYDPEKAFDYAIKSVKYWMPLDEFNQAFAGGETK